MEKIAKDLDILLGWNASSGGSDGSFVGPLNKIVIDGLGPIGGKAHSEDEFLEINSIEPRVMLLYKMTEYVANLR